MTPGPADTPPMTRNSTPGSVAVSQFSRLGSSYQNKIITALHIPVELADHKDINLGLHGRSIKPVRLQLRPVTLYGMLDSWGVFLTESLLSQILSVFSRGKPSGI